MVPDDGSPAFKYKDILALEVIGSGIYSDMLPDAGKCPSEYKL